MDSKWLSKKQRRKEALLLVKEPDLVQFQREASLHVLVSNGGLVNGLSRDALMTVLPTALHIYMPSGRDYAFVTFSNKMEAEEAVHSSNGICVQSVSEVCDLLPTSLKTGPPLHLFISYIHSLPGVCDKEHEAEPLVEESGLAIPREQQFPPGLVILHDFVSLEEEAGLISWLNMEYECDSGVECLKQRQVRHYGYRFNYISNNVDHTHPLPGGMPAPVQDLIGRIMSCGHVRNALDQVTVNRYPPGAGIPPHVDTHSVFMDEIVSLSLGSQAVMEFCGVVDTGSSTKWPVLLPARSLLIMTGASRYGYTHGIPARTFDPVTSCTDSHQRQNDAVVMTTVPRKTRISITFRALRPAPCICTCVYPLVCDSQS